MKTPDTGRLYALRTAHTADLDAGTPGAARACLEPHSNGTPDGPRDPPWSLTRSRASCKLRTPVPRDAWTPRASRVGTFAIAALCLLAVTASSPARAAGANGVPCRSQ